jgi:OOP family OmpA-OmpF porin
VELLASSEFEKADKLLNEAKDLFKDKDSANSIALVVANSRGHLKLACKKAEVVRKVLTPALDTRALALSAEANVLAPRLFEKVDEQCSHLADSITNHSNNKYDVETTELKNRYLEVQLVAIKAKRLGPAQEVIDRAIEEDAKELAPKTLGWAEKLMADANLYINGHQNDENGIIKQGAEMTAAADRLLMITREAKITKDKTPEDLVAEIEEQRNRGRELDKRIEEERLSLEQRVGEKESEVQQKDAELSEKKDTIANLEFDKKFNQSFEKAKNSYKFNEAEIKKDGNKLLIRMKGLTFPAGTSEINSSSFGLLERLKNVLKDLGDSKVTVEGHTDTLGPKENNEKISFERAQAVEKYLVSNDLVPEGKISSIGFGGEKPLASNKTKAGRAANRRVDIIVEPEFTNN